MNVYEILKTALKYDDPEKIKNLISGITKELRNGNLPGIISIRTPQSTTEIGKDYLLTELNQILETRTTERSRYYLNRLLKSFTDVKTSRINDINLNRWKEYDDIITESLWIIDRRDSTGAHKADYWGNFIPQIPYQLLIRYTKRNDWVLDPFLGSGTTLIECKRLGRNALGIDLNKTAVAEAMKKIKSEKNPYNVCTHVMTDDSSTADLKTFKEKLGISEFGFIIFHPPYWDIISFSKSKNDLSNAKSLDSFLSMFGKVFDNVIPSLGKERYFAIVIGDKYSRGEWIPLGFYLMQLVMNRGFKLKSTIVKNFNQTAAKRNQKELWRYRALAGGFYIFKHEYIFIFQK